VSDIKMPDRECWPDEVETIENAQAALRPLNILRHSPEVETWEALFSEKGFSAFLAAQDLIEYFDHMVEHRMKDVAEMVARYRGMRCGSIDKVRYGRGLNDTTYVETSGRWRRDESWTETISFPNWYLTDSVRAEARERELQEQREAQNKALVQNQAQAAAAAEKEKRRQQYEQLRKEFEE
jgi:hypothetical protein